MGYSWFSPTYDGSVPYRYVQQVYETVARAASIKLSSMEGFGGSHPWTEIDDPVKVLFLSGNYFEGDLSAEDCGLLSKRLWELAVEDDEVAEDLEWFIDQVDAGAKSGDGIGWQA